MFLDFKQSTEHGEGKKLNQIDREKLAKAISGFGNSEGGLIVWGIECSPDCTGADIAHSKKPIKNPTRFVSWIEGAVSGCTIPPHRGVKSYSVAIDEETGYVVTYIPKSNDAPHQIVSGLKDAYKYYIRAGSSFVPTPHGVLAGLFGRRPQPNIFHHFLIAPSEPYCEIYEFQIKVEVTISLRNLGPGIARDLFFNANVYSNMGSKTLVSFEPDASWISQQMFGIHFNAISKSEVRVPPESYLTPYTIRLFIKPPFDKNLRIDCACGCGDAPTTKFTIINDCAKVAKAFEKYKEKYNNNTLTTEEKYAFTRLVLSQPDE
ncbi:MAG: ATP-binding protein [Desulfosporosinus sp.]|nr:ATP-binding protein [Desulfosporosinus sp.]